MNSKKVLLQPITPQTTFCTWKTPRAALEALKDSGHHKAIEETWDQVLVLSIMGGIYVGLGAYMAILVGGNVPGFKHENPGFQKLLYGAAFTTGLMYILFTGSHLLTGNFFAIPLWLYSKKTTAKSILHGIKGIIFCALGNFIGTVAVGYFLVYLPNYDSTEPWVDYLKAMAERKTTREVYLLIFPSLGCNMIVATSLLMFACAQDAAGKILSCFFPICAFGVYGFEHVVANMFFLPTAAFFGAKVEVWRIFFWNLVPVAIGNYIGGAVLIGVPFWYAHIWRNKHHDFMEKAFAALKQKITGKHESVKIESHDDHSILSSSSAGTPADEFGKHGTVELQQVVVHSADHHEGAHDEDTITLRPTQGKSKPNVLFYY